MSRSTKKRSTDVSTEKVDRGFFAQIPLQLLNDDREGITSYTLAVYAAIQSYTTFGKTTGAHPNTEQIATRAHCSEATVERERNRLKELGYVTWIPGSFKLRRGNEYTLLFPSHRGEHSEVVSLPQRGYDPPTEGITSLPQREHRETNTESQTEKDDTELFSSKGLRHIDKDLDPERHQGTKHDPRRYRSKPAKLQKHR